MPTAVPEPTATFMLEVPDPGAVIVLGLRVTVVPVGLPVADSVTALLKPPPIAVVIVEVPCAPCVKLSDDGLALTVKVGCGAVTVKLTVVVCCSPPPLAVTVMG